MTLSVTKEFLKRRKLAKEGLAGLFIIAAGILSGGCASLPDTPATAQGDLKAYTMTDAQGIVRYPGTLEPVRGVDGACQMLSAEAAALGRENHTFEESLTRFGHAISDPYKGKPAQRSWVTQGIVGTLGATVNTIGEVGRSAGQAIDSHAKQQRLDRLSRQCQQNRAWDDWRAAQAQCTIRVSDSGGTTFSGNQRSRTGGQTTVDQDCVQTILERNIMRGAALPVPPQSPLEWK